MRSLVSTLGLHGAMPCHRASLDGSVTAWDAAGRDGRGERDVRAAKPEQQDGRDGRDVLPKEERQDTRVPHTPGPRLTARSFARTTRHAPHGHGTRFPGWEPPTPDFCFCYSPTLGNRLIRVSLCPPAPLPHRLPSTILFRKPGEVAAPPPVISPTPLTITPALLFPI